MAYRLDIKRILSMNFFHDLPQIMLGWCLGRHRDRLVFDSQRSCRRWRYGLATIIQAVGAARGLSLPVGIQTIVMNALLLLVVMQRGRRSTWCDRDGLCAAGLLYRSVRPVCSTSGGCGPDASRYVGRHYYGHRLRHGVARRAPTPAARTRLAKSSRVTPHCRWARPSWRSMLP